MKKIISALIILTVIASMLSMVCFAVDDEEYCPPAAVWTVRGQYAISAYGEGNRTPFKNISFGTGDKITLNFYIVNNTDAVLNSVGLSCAWGQNVYLSEDDAAGNNAVSGTRKAVNLQPGASAKVGIVVPRRAYYSNAAGATTQGANDGLGVLINGEDAALRVDFSKTPSSGGTISFICLSDESVTESFASTQFYNGASAAKLVTNRHSFALSDTVLPATATEYGGTQTVCAYCGKTKLAERSGAPTGFDFTGETYEPVEARFTSNKTYDNPYTDVEINAVFTHQSGTSISLPGFWYGDNIFAFRFSPTLAGRWTYTVSCTDASNTSLNGLTGSITAVKNTTGTTNTARHGFVRVSDDGRYFEYEDGTPFFWLGDTNWQAPQMLSTTSCNYPGCSCGGQFQHIVNDRISKGFTVFQTYFAGTSASASQGNESYWSITGSLVNTDVWNERLDYEFKYLSDNDMVAVVGFGCHNSTPRVISREDMIRLARYIVARYACYNILWFSGQEITDNTVATATDQSDGVVTAMDVYMDLSAAVTEYDGYKHPNSSHMYVMKSSDSRAKRLADASWHTYWLLQAGHSAVQQNKTFYQSYYYNENVTTGNAVQPVIEGEANYEEINCGGFTGYNASRYCAWKALLCGCAGFTYGATGVWIGAYSNVKGYGACYGATTSYSYDPWYMGVDKPGSSEVSYMKSFFTRLPSWQSLIPRFYDTAYFSEAANERKLMSSASDASTVVLYFYNTDISTGTVKKLNAAYTYKAMWFNPRTGNYIACDITVNGSECVLPAKPTSEDWALVITGEEISGFYTEKPYRVKSALTAVKGTRLTPVKFTANGGSYYNDDCSLSDYADYLIDGVSQTVWEPLNDRVTQTFVFDFGTCQALSAVTITPESGTVLPDYRVYASNDANVWYIICDTSLNGVQNKIGDDYAEALEGSYRYVKVLLLNAKGLSADTDEYETFYNPKTGVYCSHTAISEIAVYGRSTKSKTENSYEFSIPEKKTKTVGNLVNDSLWSTSFLGGNIEHRSDSDGAYAAYYCGEHISNTWYSPTLSVYGALKQLVSGSTSELVCVSYKVRADFDDTISSTVIKPFLRGMNGSGGYTVSGGGKTGTWRSGYNTYCAGSSAGALLTESNGNILKNDSAALWTNWGSFTLTEDWYEWHGLISVSAASLNDAFLSDIAICIDGVKDYAHIKELHFKDVCVCLASDADAPHSYCHSCTESAACSVCGYKCTAPGHELVSSVVYPTEERDGYTLNTCINCMYSSKTDLKPKTKATVIGASPALTEGIALDVYVATTEKYASALMRFEYGGKTELCEGEQAETAGDTYIMRYRLNGITPDGIENAVKFSLLYGEETIIGETEYSVGEYIRRIKASSAEELNITNEKYANLLNLLDELTAYAEAVKGYENGVAVSPSLSFKKLKETDLQIGETKNEAFRFTGAGLTVGENIGVYFSFTAESIASVTVTVAHGGSSKTYSSGDFIYKNGAYRLYTDMLMPDEYDDTVTAVLTVEGADVQRLNFSVASYVYEMQNETENNSLTPLASLVRSLYAYGQAAQKYTGRDADKSYFFKQ